MSLLTPLSNTTALDGSVLCIPAKTFLVGEYAAMFGGPAMVLTTLPCFEVEIVTAPDNNLALHGIHPESPAGLWWASQLVSGYGLSWSDPYQGLGGLGASSAQFVGAYVAYCQLSNTTPTLEALLSAYYLTSWQGDGLRPSGYDVIAQAQRACVAIHQQAGFIQSYDWVFDDIAFILLHSGQKLKTHEHLQSIHFQMDSMHQLFDIAESAQRAFEQCDSALLLDAVNNYHAALVEKKLVASHTLGYLNELKVHSPVLAAKGCGAMGADVILVIVARDNLSSMKDCFQREGRTILADSDDLYVGLPLITNIISKNT